MRLWVHERRSCQLLCDCIIESYCTLKFEWIIYFFMLLFDWIFFVFIIWWWWLILSLLVGIKKIYSWMITYGIKFNFIKFSQDTLMEILFNRLVRCYPLLIVYGLNYVCNNLGFTNLKKFNLAGLNSFT